MVNFNFKRKRYVLNTSRLLFNLIVLILIATLTVGYFWASNEDYKYEVEKHKTQNEK